MILSGVWVIGLKLFQVVIYQLLSFWAWNEQASTVKSPDLHAGALACGEFTSVHTLVIRPRIDSFLEFDCDRSPFFFDSEVRVHGFEDCIGVSRCGNPDPDRFYRQCRPYVAVNSSSKNRFNVIDRLFMGVRDPNSHGVCKVYPVRQLGFQGSDMAFSVKEACSVSDGSFCEIQPKSGTASYRDIFPCKPPYDRRMWNAIGLSYLSCRHSICIETSNRSPITPGKPSHWFYGSHGSASQAKHSYNSPSACIKLSCYVSRRFASLVHQVSGSFLPRGKSYGYVAEPDLNSGSFNPECNCFGPAGKFFSDRYGGLSGFVELENFRDFFKCNPIECSFWFSYDPCSHVTSLSKQGRPWSEAAACYSKRRPCFMVA